MTSIRVAELGDAAAIAAIYRPIVRDTWISFEIDPPSADEMAGRIARTLPSYPWLVATNGDDVLGYAYASSRSERAAYQWSSDVTIYLDEAARGKGLGRQLYQSLFSVLRRQGIRNAFAGIALPNAASVALHESVGFVLLGVYADVGFKLGAWRSVGWWQCRLAETTGAPLPTIPFARLRERAGFAI